MGLLAGRRSVRSLPTRATSRTHLRAEVMHELHRATPADARGLRGVRLTLGAPSAQSKPRGARGALPEGNGLGRCDPQARIELALDSGKPPAFSLDQGEPLSLD